ncbi:histidine phosphatase family protein [Roseobacteraceae bacterium S113]
MPPIYVLRHGETEWNAQARFQGAANSPLTEQGRAQAKAQGAALGQIDLGEMRVFVSPQSRAIETAALALGPLVSHMHTDPRLRELEVGAWTGASRDQLRGVSGPTYADTPDGHLALYEHAPGGEGYASLRARCEAFLAELTGPTLCVTHGITSRMLRILALGRPTAQLGELPGGQGLVHVVKDGVHSTLGATT